MVEWGRYFRAHRRSGAIEAILPSIPLNYLRARMNPHCKGSKGLT